MTLEEKLLSMTDDAVELLAETARLLRVNAELVAILREADVFFREELEEAGYVRTEIEEHPMLLKIRSVVGEQEASHEPVR